MLKDSSVPLCADVTRIIAGTPSFSQALLIFKQWSLSDGDPIIITAWPAGCRRNFCKKIFKIRPLLAYN